jgi:hypothetical protein
MEHEELTRNGRHVPASVSILSLRDLSASNWSICKCLKWMDISLSFARVACVVLSDLCLCGGHSGYWTSNWKFSPLTLGLFPESDAWSYAFSLVQQKNWQALLGNCNTGHEHVSQDAFFLLLCCIMCSFYRAKRYLLCLICELMPVNNITIFDFRVSPKLLLCAPSIVNVIFFFFWIKVNVIFKIRKLEISFYAVKCTERDADVTAHGYLAINKLCNSSLSSSIFFRLLVNKKLITTFAENQKKRCNSFQPQEQ